MLESKIMIMIVMIMINQRFRILPSGKLLHN